MTVRKGATGTTRKENVKQEHFEEETVLDKIEAFARKVAAKGYLIVAAAAFIYIVLRAQWRVVCAAVIMVGSFIAYCCLEEDEEDDDEE